MTEEKSDPVERLAHVVRQAEVRMSDMRRARGAQELVERLRREAKSPVAQVARRRTLWWPLAVAAAAAAAAALILLMPRREPSMDRIPHPMTPPETAPVARLPAGDEALAILRPLSGPGSEAGHARLQSRPGEDVRAWLADCGRVVLRGASVLVVERNDLDGILLRMDRGTLLVSFDHHSGRSLKVRTPDALVRVTGTVFAVTVDEGPSRVSVSRGSVEVAAGGLPVSVTAGKSWLVGAASLSAPDAATALALRELRALDSPPTGGAAARMARATSGTGESRELEPPSGRAPSVPQTSTALAARDRQPQSRSGAAVPQDAESIYRAAEDALSEGRSGTAKALLETLVTNHPRAPLAGPALYELGRLSFAAGDYARARELLKAVRENRQPAAARFHEPATFLLCRSELGAGERKAALLCLERFLVAFPDSPHASDVRALLATVR